MASAQYATAGGGQSEVLLPEGSDPALPSHHVKSPTFFGGRFQNPWPTWQDRGFSAVWQWQRERRKAGAPQPSLAGNPHPTAKDYAAAFPCEPIDFKALNTPPEDAVQALWVGHATLLVQLGGVTFLTDPIFSERCSGSQLIGPKRYVPSPLDVESPQLPRIDFVVISHNHYDHLDTGSVKRLHKRFGNSLTWYVPLGLAAWFHSSGVTNVVELDWWQEAQHGASGVKVAFTPAQHWSMRTLWNRKASLWGSWVVASQQRRFWFAGDTGYCPVFPEIGARYGPFDLAAIPIGAYEPRWFMGPQHVDPAEAIKVHQEVRSQRSVAIHCCTFPLTDEPIDEPPALLANDAAAAGLAADEFVTMRHGGIIQTAGGQDLAPPPLMQLRQLGTDKAANV